MHELGIWKTTMAGLNILILSNDNGWLWIKNFENDNGRPVDSLHQLVAQGHSQQCRLLHRKPLRVLPWQKNWNRIAKAAVTIQIDIEVDMKNCETRLLWATWLRIPDKYSNLMIHVIAVLIYINLKGWRNDLCICRETSNRCPAAWSMIVKIKLLKSLFVCWQPEARFVRITLSA